MQVKLSELSSQQLTETMIERQHFDEKLLRDWLSVKSEMGELDSLPMTLNIEIDGKFYNVIVPMNTPEYACISNLPFYPVAVAKTKLEYHEIADSIILSDYKSHGVVSSAMREFLVMAQNKQNSYPFIYEIVTEDEKLTLSMLTENALHMNPSEWTARYVDYQDLTVYNRKTLNERFENGPSNSSDEMFQEVGNSLQEAIQEVKEPPLAEHMEGGIGEDGLYIVKTTRQFRERQEYLDYMRKVMDL
ncbi:hypothetical protein [Vibrio phage 2 TSL-2019]|uniref:Uncharacterized protein n=1 Tax=Vibrio phage 2 TSL-2019 TaxID=2508172 RepID=A0A513PWG9_9CAUD|nr:hypothetical protein HWC03_gp141 [Vibrio phage 2 TSL-2019]QAU04296.1 hypothetical protein [Vibrio phage 2 TSL-2019]